MPSANVNPGGGLTPEEKRTVTSLEKQLEQLEGATLANSFGDGGAAAAAAVGIGGVSAEEAFGPGPDDDESGTFFERQEDPDDGAPREIPVEIQEAGGPAGASFFSSGAGAGGQVSDSDRFEVMIGLLSELPQRIAEELRGGGV